MSSKKLPAAAKVHRTGRTRRKKGKSRGAGLFKTLAGPVGLVALGLGVVLAAGWWAQHMPAAKTTSAPAKQTPQSTTPPAKQEPAPPSGNQQPPAAKSEPPKADPNQAILDKRSHIDRAAGATATRTMKIYYVDGLKNGETLQPVEIQLAQSKSLIQTAAEQVINAPADLKLYSSVPAGTKVKSVDLKPGGVAVVDLTPEISQVRGAASVQNIVASFVYSLTEIKGVTSVQLWVNGRPAMLDQLEWSKPISRTELDGRNLFKVQPVIPYSAKS